MTDTEELDGRCAALPVRLAVEIGTQEGLPPSLGLRVMNQDHLEEAQAVLMIAPERTPTERRPCAGLGAYLEKQVKFEETREPHERGRAIGAGNENPPCQRTVRESSWACAIACSLPSRVGNPGVTLQTRPLLDEERILARE
ncbi:MAG: hypothetical protein V3T22_05125 [Planctomycetota bacterium]